MNVLLGPTLSGKTTLMRLMAGLDRPTTGRLTEGGLDVTNVPVRRRSVAMVYQQFVNYPSLTVYENIASPLRVAGLVRAEIDGRVNEAAMLDLTGVLNRRARGLTAGAKQKISLGRALVRLDVSAVLFDEPLTVIDPALKWELRSKLKAVHRALDLLMIYVTHDQIEALTFADKVVVTNEGRPYKSARPLICSSGRSTHSSATSSALQA
jgi:glycerol transport system ATP-binding protein